MRIRLWLLMLGTEGFSCDKIRKRKVPVYPEKSIEMCNKKCYF